ncbi:hypothetical protein EMCRGX_G028954 [Ephydatia muelleri]
MGLRSLYHHSSACFIASICQSGIALGENHHLEQSIDDLNHIVGESEAVCVQDILNAPPRQRNLSSKIEDHQLRMLFDLASSPAQCARLLSVSSPHASAWLSVMPTPQLNLHLEPPEFQVALKWWIGMDTSQNACCAFSVETHGCWGDDTIKCLDRLAARIAIRTARPKSSVVSALYGRLSIVLVRANARAILARQVCQWGAAALEAEVRKHRANDPKCSELGWVCVPLAVETYGNWGKEAHATFSRLASSIATTSSLHRHHLFPPSLPPLPSIATTSSCHKSQVLGEILISDLGGLVLAMGAMRVVVVLVPVVGLVQVAVLLLLLLAAAGAVLQLLLVGVGSALLQLLLAVGAALLLLLAVGAALLLLLAVGAALLLLLAVGAALLLLLAVGAALLLLLAVGAALLLLAVDGRGAALHLTESIETKCKI